MNNHSLVGITSGAGYTNEFYVKDVEAFAKAVEQAGHFARIHEEDGMVEVHLSEALFQNDKVVSNAQLFDEFPIDTDNDLIDLLLEHAIYGQVITLRQIIITHGYPQDMAEMASKMAPLFSFDLIAILADGSVERLVFKPEIKDECDNADVMAAMPAEIYTPALIEKRTYKEHAEWYASLGKTKKKSELEPADVEIIPPRPEGQGFNQNRAGSNRFFVKDTTAFTEVMKQWRANVLVNDEQGTEMFESVMLVVDAPSWPTEQLDILHRHIQEHMQEGQVVVLLDAPRHPADINLRALFTVDGAQAFIEKQGTTAELSEYAIELFEQHGQ